jgi:hypothetical protein
LTLAAVPKRGGITQCGEIPQENNVELRMGQEAEKDGRG